MITYKQVLQNIIYAIATLLFFNNISLAQITPAKTTDPVDKEAEKESATENLVNKIGSDISAIVENNKAPSLMLDFDEHRNVNRAVESLKNNQTFVPEAAQVDMTLIKKDDDIESQNQQKESQKVYVYLGSILYYSPQDWAVWVNNQKITPKENSTTKELYLKSVEEDKAKLIWTLSMTKWKIISGKKSESLAPKINDKNQVEVEFELRPNQTFNLSNNKVTEGRVSIASKQPIKLDKKKGLNNKTVVKTTDNSKER